MSRTGIALMTLHSAKGLEFDAVFLAGLEDGLLPHANSRDDLEALEEERRLAYVGMTRARRRLALTAARSRFLFGQRQPTRLSRFLDELPRDEIEDLSMPISGLPGGRPEIRDPRKEDPRHHPGGRGRAHLTAARRQDSGDGQDGRRHRMEARRPRPPPQIRIRRHPRLPGHGRATQVGGLLRQSRPENTRPDNCETRENITSNVLTFERSAFNVEYLADRERCRPTGIGGFDEERMAPYDGARSPSQRRCGRWLGRSGDPGHDGPETRSGKSEALAGGKVLAGFAGSVADALALFTRFEAKLEEFGHNLERAAVELAREWRTDKALRHLEAMLITADTQDDAAGFRYR